MSTIMNMDISCQLQKVTISLEELPKNIKEIEKQISKAMNTYSWIYSDEDEHDVLVKILIKRKFTPKQKK